jgi:asparagine synthase (glutamine-hydrolysing)
MCGIVGIVDLSGRQRPVPAGALRAMADSILHRGPDEDGYLEEPGIGLGNRRLSIVGLQDGRQPIGNEDGSVWVVFNGELFDYPEMRDALTGRGHQFHTHCDTEIIPHCYEEYGDRFLDHLRGQFAFALLDERRRRLVLARDRFGVCPLYYSVQPDAEGGWLLFASEARALFASGMVVPRTDLRGLHHLFTFIALPGPVTCFEGVHLLLPGHYIDVPLARPGAEVEQRPYWQIDFPDEGEEDYGTDPDKLADRLEEVLIGSVTRRLRADVPVVSYISGGVDSSIVVALANHIRGEPIPTFTIGIKARGLDETSEALLTARHVGSEPVVVDIRAQEISDAYPELIAAAEAPVIDTSCAALLRLAQCVHDRGYKVALTGEGSDEWLAGYPWHKIFRMLGWLDVVPGLPVSLWLRRAILKFNGTDRQTWPRLNRVHDLMGGHNGWFDFYGLLSIARERFLSRSTREALADHFPWDDLRLNRERIRRWHPLNRELYLSARILLAGLLLSSKGDRVAMHSSVETRYPFLDEEVFDLLARVPPRLKLNGLNDKVILRRMARRWIPRQIADRQKVIFRAPFDSFRFADHSDGVTSPRPPSWADQLLSEESLRRTGYFDPDAVRQERQQLGRGLKGRLWLRRMAMEMGLVGVLAAQLWHHTFIEGGLAELPTLAGSWKREAAGSRFAVLGNGYAGDLTGRPSTGAYQPANNDDRHRRD